MALTLTIIVVAIVASAFISACIAANRRGRRQAAQWRASIARDDALRGSKA